MAVRTIRFNKEEESALSKLLEHYGSDFSTCVKTLLFDRLEDLKDIVAVSRIRKGKRTDYERADDIDALFRH